MCAGEGAGVIANIWNASLDRSNICTMLGEKTEESGANARKDVAPPPLSSRQTQMTQRMCGFVA